MHKNLRRVIVESLEKEKIQSEQETFQQKTAFLTHQFLVNQRKLIPDYWYCPCMLCHVSSVSTRKN